ncbi:hypothetical protein SAMN04489712_12190 [Thermomonospora echinospora]|uniref:Uncharacterized protein n=1 Tax=Thermomonospora echinospora TaxID=1992 RepID=A0A1H6DSG7_9ACTN|nr:hypothetical protein [Thermomonospora echinospora]SEG88170.1 hypothetical protein SAMN04489712_12190 [Thermomonospora echinospora]
MDELDELAQSLRLRGVRVLRVADGVMISLDRGADTARAYVVVIVSWLSGERCFAWGPVRSMRCPAAEVEAAALYLLAHLREAPFGQALPAWPDPVRDCTGAGRLRGRLRQLRARFGATVHGRW